MLTRTTTTITIKSALPFRTCDDNPSVTGVSLLLLLPSFKLHNISTRVGSGGGAVRGRRGGDLAVTRASMKTSSTTSTTVADGGGGSGSGGLLQKGIAEFYDESSGIWEDIWGDHMHHGFYDPDVQASISDHRSAQIRMIEQSLSFAGLNNDKSLKIPKTIVDVGCGIGGSSRYLTRKYGAKCQGITLSPIQAQRAQELANAQGLGENVSFQVADALQQPFPDGQFDLVWSMESGEHMPDKAKFVNELIRVASPGGTIIIVTWCHRDLSPSEDSLQPQEKELLKKICDAYYLPAWCSTADYVKLLQSLQMEVMASSAYFEWCL
ncbi:Tocopherol o-methyltransferase protein [Thalictrum thalictroides]|uniref:Tocopherol o-methyltransferase protein n=1 Tax=Thalictrum thalictroides TaxID=46969 RepID=A0A7J6VZZ2_THATH|nr:Tocopherol o-methyltransferase protein [Thalictrum thalictroides]